MGRCPAGRYRRDVLAQERQVMYALAGPEVATQVQAAHAEAVRQTLEYLEPLAARALRGRRAARTAR